MYQFMLLPIEGHLGYFHFLKIMNNTTLNMHEQVFMWTQVSTHLSKYQGVQLLNYLLFHILPPHPPQHLVLSLLWFLDILIGLLPS